MGDDADCMKEVNNNHSVVILVQFVHCILDD